MIKKALSFLGLGIAVAHGQSSSPQNLSKLYPYVVTAEYLTYDAVGADSVNWPLGHGLHVVLVFEDGERVTNAKQSELKKLGADVETAKRKSIENLQILFKSGVVKAVRFTGPEDKSFILIGGHWASATCILLPELWSFARKNLGTNECLVCIPHREALLIFPRGDSGYRDLMMKMIQEKEKDGRKPLSFGFFKVGPDGVTEFNQ